LANCTNVNNALTWFEGVTSAVHKLLEKAYTIDLPHRSSPADYRMLGPQEIFDLGQSNNSRLLFGAGTVGMILAATRVPPSPVDRLVGGVRWYCVTCSGVSTTVCQPP
jgi:hypothetical protein